MLPCSPQGGRRMAARPSFIAAVAVISAAFAPSAASAATAHAASVAKVRQADNGLVAAAKNVVSCERKAGKGAARCAPQRARLQAAGLKLSKLQRTVAHRASSTSAGRLKAPAVTIAGTTLKWNKVGDVTSYVMVTAVAGKADQFSVVTGTQTTPATQAGRTVAYSLRTAVVGSAWSNQAKIAYPAKTTTAPTAPATTTPAAASPLTAPTLTASGNTLRWNQVAGVTAYKYVIKVPGQADAYVSTTGTSVTPPVVPGKTVRYSVRTDVDGSAWAKEIAITYPANAQVTPAPSTQSSTPAPSTGTTAPTQPSAPAPSTDAGFQTGLVASSGPIHDVADFKTLGARSARVEFDIDQPASDLASVMDAYAKAGIQPLILAGFQGRIPTEAEGRNLASWAAAYGPNGTFWAGKSYPAGTAVTHIEFGNESNQGYQYPQLANDPNWANNPYYTQVAKGYATAFKAGAVAVQGANAGVSLLAISDTPGNWDSWMNGVFAAVPNFGDYVGGWVVHPYGPQSAWQPTIDNAMAQVAKHGASARIPIYVTEYGISSDNGRCLDDNYGWNACMTYQQAGDALSSTVAAMRSRYGARLAGMYLFQAHDQQASGSTNREYYFGGLTVNGAAKGGYTTAMESVLAA
jgi:hypothetical protein